MIVEIEQARPSCRPSLDYNEGKVLRGVAELVAYANMESTDSKYIYELFDRYEKTRYYVAEKSFHASVNPSETDTCTEDQVLEFISGLMDHLGYGRQPFLVYRHFDIDREHYHIVSVRADKTGRKINNYYEKRRATAYMREVAAQYGFTLAPKGSQVRVSKDISGDQSKAVRFNPRGEALSQLTGIYKAALSYDHEGFSQLSCILEDLGVRATLIQTDGGQRITLQGLDRKGNPVTEIYNEQEIGQPLYQMAATSWAGHSARRGRNARQKERVRSLVGFAFGISKSEGHFVNILKNKGIGVHLSKTADTGEVFGITFVDHSTRTVFKASDIRDVISVGLMRNAVATGKWRVEDRGRARNAYVKDARVNAREDSERMRDLRAGVVARVLRPVGQPRGASWSGKVKPDKDQQRAKFDEERAGAMDVNFEDRRYEEKLR